MNRIHHKVFFDHLRSFMFGQVPKDLTKMLSLQPKYFLLPPLEDDHYAILTTPSCMEQALIFLYCQSPSLGRDFKFTMTDV